MFKDTEIASAVEGLRQRNLLPNWPRIAVFLIALDTGSRDADDIVDEAWMRGIRLSRGCAEEALRRISWGC